MRLRGEPRTFRLVFAILAIGFFATPIAARVAGVTAESFENRRLAEPPRLAQGWDAFQQAGSYLTDHMPLRAQAVRANTRIWTDIFGTDPRYGKRPSLAGDQALPFAGTITSRAGAERRPGGGGGPDRGPLQGPVTAVTGPDGWLFVGAELQFGCKGAISYEELVDRWSEAVGAIRATGREAVMFAVPQKASVYPEHLPKEYPNDHCLLAEKDRLWSVLAERGADRGVLELRSDLVRRKRTEGDELFDRTDMHWTTLGALSLVEGALRELGDGIEMEPNEVVDQGSVSQQGDLDVVSGRDRQTVRREYGIDRAPGAPRVRGRTLIVCDSFADKWLRLFRPYFEDLEVATIYNPGSDIAAAVERSDRVLIEANEVIFKAGDGLKAREIVAALRRR